MVIGLTIGIAFLLNRLVEVPSIRLSHRFKTMKSPVITHDEVRSPVFEGRAAVTHSHWGQRRDLLGDSDRRVPAAARRRKRLHSAGGRGAGRGGRRGDVYAPPQASARTRPYRGPGSSAAGPVRPPWSALARPGAGPRSTGPDLDSIRPPCVWAEGDESPIRRLDRRPGQAGGPGLGDVSRGGVPVRAPAAPAQPIGRRQPNNGPGVAGAADGCWSRSQPGISYSVKICPRARPANGCRCPAMWPPWPTRRRSPPHALGMPRTRTPACRALRDIRADGSPTCSSRPSSGCSRSSRSAGSCSSAGDPSDTRRCCRVLSGTGRAGERDRRTVTGCCSGPPSSLRPPPPAVRGRREFPAEERDGRVGQPSPDRHQPGALSEPLWATSTGATVVPGPDPAALAAASVEVLALPHESRLVFGAREAELYFGQFTLERTIAAAPRTRVSNPVNAPICHGQLELVIACTRQ